MVMTNWLLCMRLLQSTVPSIFSIWTTLVTICQAFVCFCVSIMALAHTLEDQCGSSGYFWWKIMQCSVNRAYSLGVPLFPHRAVPVQCLHQLVLGQISWRMCRCVAFLPSHLFLQSWKKRACWRPGFVGRFITNGQSHCFATFCFSQVSML